MSNTSNSEDREAMEPYGGRALLERAAGDAGVSVVDYTRSIELFFEGVSRESPEDRQKVMDQLAHAMSQYLPPGQEIVFVPMEDMR